MSNPEHVAIASRKQRDNADPVLADFFSRATGGERLMFLRRTAARIAESEPNAYYYDDDGHPVETRISLGAISVLHTKALNHRDMYKGWVARMNALPPDKVINRTVALPGFLPLHQATHIPDNPLRKDRTTRYYVANDRVVHGADLRGGGHTQRLLGAEELPKSEEALEAVRSIAQSMGVPAMALALSIDAIATDGHFILTHVNTNPRRIYPTDRRSLEFPAAEVDAMLALRHNGMS